MYVCIYICVCMYIYKGGGTYGQDGPKVPPTFEILKTCPSITSAPIIPFHFLLLLPTINT